jgi:protein CWC15
MNFDKGQYSMGSLPSRQVAQRDLTSHTRLKLRRTKYDSTESTEERLKRLKEDLVLREKKAEEEKKPITDKEEDKTNQEFDDADEIPSAASSDEGDEEPIAPIKAPNTRAQKQEDALQKELERIRREKLAREQAQGATSSLKANPLLEKGSLQRRWDDDVIFRNQAKTSAQTKEKRLVNDVVHSDKHKDFLKKFIV